MNRIYVFTTIVLLIACTDDKQSSSNQMRRFTFAAFNQLEDTTIFQTITSDIALQQSLKDTGVVNYDYCTIDSITYLVLDMEETFDLEQTSTLITAASFYFLIILSR